MKNVQGLLVDAEHGTIAVCSTPNSLKSYYKILQCDTIDIISARFGPYVLDVFCDDEALLKNSFTVSAVDENHKPILVGNLFIASHDEEGNTISLEKEHIDYILKRCVLLVIQGGKVRSVVVCSR